MENELCHRRWSKVNSLVDKLFSRLSLSFFSLRSAALGLAGVLAGPGQATANGGNAQNGAAGAAQHGGFGLGGGAGLGKDIGLGLAGVGSLLGLGQAGAAGGNLN